MTAGAVGEEDRRDVLTEGHGPLRLRNCRPALHDEYGGDHGAKSQHEKSVMHDGNSH
jgi:hypothetical protein